MTSKSSENITFTSSISNVPVEDLSYEQARSELMNVVTAMESGTSSLEEIIALWERGEELANRCEAWLDGAHQRLNAARQERLEQNSSES
ncbi:exodeoxyribonuclease VII small subunit [Rothia sp. CCM 9418]|uniref:exodeoxyribonuclease VII small subunit n=1 Tax=unclassified Rothia (in: high G+C Gram-positive bacteria) TaxID=2689056 RepID=UPI003AD54221